VSTTTKDLNLTNALVIDAVYKGGRTGNSGDDPLHPLIGVSNQGGFRYIGTKEAPRLLVLTSSQKDPDWPDNFDRENGIYTYYGDNKQPGRALHDTPRFGNLLLRAMFANSHGSREERIKVPPVLVFSGTGEWRDVSFLGLAVPGGENLSAGKDLVAVWHTSQGEKFQNYEAKFTILDTAQVSMEWLNAVKQGEPLGTSCPYTWREWVETGRYIPLKRRRTPEIMAEDAPGLDEGIPQTGIAPPPNPFHSLTLPHFFSDSNSNELEDQLNFENDVQALASVMVFRKVEPPLAIGLFGNWGMGKSFFINKLQKQIEELGATSEIIFCRNVLQINFNSWHYSDSNLWASLITKIFEELERYGETAKSKDKVSRLLRHLNTTRELLAETESQKHAVERKIAELKSERAVVERSISQQARKLKGISVQEMIGAIYDDPGIREDIRQLDRKYSFIRLESNKIKENIEALEGPADKFITSLKIIYSLRHGRNWIVTGLFIAAVSLLYFLKQDHAWIRQYSYGFALFLTTLAGVFTQLLVFLRPAIEKVNTAYRELRRIKNIVDGLTEKAREKAANEVEHIKEQLAREEEQSNELQKNIEILTIRKESLQNEIDDIGSGRKIARFIADRVADSRYNDNLGIISWIRKDFEELDFLLKEQYDARKLAATGREKVENVFHLERIILYIDDLDRCNETIVIKVLEAIHLLLAFPLFVVVVGVDPRWMNKALAAKYPHLAGSRNDGKDEMAQPDAVDRPATTYDYLEKIFQIPFALKPMDRRGKHNLIKAQFANSEYWEAKPSLEEAPVQEGTAVPDVSQTGEEIESREEPLRITEGNKRGMAGELPLPTQVPREIKLESLKITDQEIQFMQDISHFIGDSPRTLKRYINIYRIVRAHGQFKTEAGKELQYYSMALLLLAVITGMPATSKHFFGHIARSDGNNRFDDCLQMFVNPADGDDKVSRLKMEVGQGGIFQSIAELPVAMAQDNLGLIARFSFRMNN